MSTPQYVTKTLAIQRLQFEMGLGRWVIEKRLDQLIARGVIIIEPDPADARKLRLTEDDLEKLRRSLRGENV